MSRVGLMGHGGAGGGGSGSAEVGWVDCSRSQKRRVESIQDGMKDAFFLVWAGVGNQSVAQPTVACTVHSINNTTIVRSTRTSLPLSVRRSRLSFSRRSS